MNFSFITGQRFFAVVVLSLVWPCVGISAPLDDIGVTGLWELDPSLTGAGVTVGMVEAQNGAGLYQINPSTTGLPADRFRFYESASPYGGTGAAYSSEKESWHANSVGDGYFDVQTGVAPGVARVENFEAEYFYNQIVSRVFRGTWTPTSVASQVVNQSFVFSTSDATTIATVSRFYDAYANQYGTLFINGLNNDTGTLTNAPASMFNGIRVGRLDGNHSGSPDLIAPGSATSFAAPYVSGAAAILIQAAERGDVLANAGTNPADARVIKAVLLSGATKTEGWTNSATTPLDASVGAGIVNVLNSYHILSAGQKATTLTEAVAHGVTPVARDFTSLAALEGNAGWDLRSLTASTTTDQVAYYLFDLSNDAEVTLSFTATLTWNSLADVALATNQISNFDLLLIDVANQAIVGSSVGDAQNIEHLYLTGLAPGQYSLQVILRGGDSAPIFTDTYALAYQWDPVVIPEPQGIALLAFGILTAMVVSLKKMRLN